MASSNRVNMPSGMGGLVRYFDDYRSKVQLSPGNLIVVIVVIIVIELLLHWKGMSLLGLG